ncbi:sulfate adenylyltransferase, partial [Bacillus cereus group sp. Bce025]
HDSKEHLHLSGTKVREMLKKGTKPPKQFSRPEVAEILIQGMRGLKYK